MNVRAGGRVSIPRGDAQTGPRLRPAERRRDVDPELVHLADRWEARAADEFWRGYQSVSGIDRLLPAFLNTLSAQKIKGTRTLLK